MKTKLKLMAIAMLGMGVATAQANYPNGDGINTCALGITKT